MATNIRNTKRSITIPSRPTTANRLLLCSFRLEMTIAVAVEDSLFSLFWSIQPPCEIDEAILFDMTDKGTEAWVIFTSLGKRARGRLLVATTSYPSAMYSGIDPAD